jgi:hypothetical protein
MLQLLHEATEAKSRPKITENPSSSLFCISLMGQQPSQQQNEVPSSLYLMAARLTSRPLHKRRVIALLRPLLLLHEGRNQALFDTAVCFRRELIREGIVTVAGAEDLLMEASRLNGFIATRGEDAAIRTVLSGLGLYSIEEVQKRRKKRQQTP